MNWTTKEISYYPKRKIQAKDYFDEVGWEYLHPIIDRQNYIHAIDLITLAIAQHESTGRNGYITDLAYHFNNFGGIKHSKRGGKYAAVTFPPNQFESEPQTYRVYRSPTLGLSNIKWHLTDSSHYAQAYRDLNDEIRNHTYANIGVYLIKVGKVWCPVDPKWHDKVLKHYSYWYEDITSFRSDLHIKGVFTR